MVTALTLHADAQHILGNALSGTIFGSMVARRSGPGGALLTIVLSGAIGNFANAIYHLPDPHRSIGASTAVFGAVGILAAVQTVVDIERYRRGNRAELRRRYGVVDMLAPVVGGLALLGALGSGRHTDLGAHGFGFLAGVGIGTLVGLVIRRHDAKPSRFWQLAAGAAACAIVAGAWTLATL
jgi:membrane associated rhomboid family serine protease